MSLMYVVNLQVTDARNDLHSSVHSSMQRGKAKDSR